VIRSALCVIFVLLGFPCVLLSSHRGLPRSLLCVFTPHTIITDNTFVCVHTSHNNNRQHSYYYFAPLCVQRYYCVIRSPLCVIWSLLCDAVSFVCS